MINYPSTEDQQMATYRAERAMITLGALIDALDPAERAAIHYTLSDAARRLEREAGPHGPDSDTLRLLAPRMLLLDARIHIANDRHGGLTDPFWQEMANIGEARRAAEREARRRAPRYGDDPSEAPSMS